ncbi:uncharacterized protein LOC131695008 [Topomyia yanbarensis]|uniref:uncharacterized protein LOC131695008 n=1 Tax=Topomyia yanbarensis TaxID=2498891 RepID=UPI00273B3DA5|nr:uncharacterized protein LOC131695008 [Topomyia yanbarensis]
MELPLVLVESEHSFRQGECFSSYEQFIARLERHSANDFVHYWRRDSRTIEGAALKTARPIAAALRYYSVRYSCIFGGQRFTTKSTGTKRVRSTLRNDCPAYIALRASKCGQQLVVMGTSNVHNHEVTEEINKNLAHNKKLSAGMKHEVLVLLFHNIDKKLIREYVRLKNGKELTTKDLFNLAASLRKNSCFERMILDTKRSLELVAELKEYINKNGSYFPRVSSVELHMKLEVEKSPQSDVASHCTDTTEERLLNDNSSGMNAYVNNSKDDQMVSGSIQNDYTNHDYVFEFLDDPVIPKSVANRKRARWKPVTCFTCGANNQIVRAQLDVLRARRDKLREETQLLKLKKQKLKMELRLMKQNIHDLK